MFFVCLKTSSVLRVFTLDQNTLFKIVPTRFTRDSEETPCFPGTFVFTVPDDLSVSSLKFPSPKRDTIFRSFLSVTPVVF